MENTKIFEQAQAALADVVHATPLVYSPFFSRETGNQIYLKPENMQVTGSFKVRGAFFKISTLTQEERAKGLVTSSAGNHAQGVAYAASRLGIKATIVMPSATPLVKVNRTMQLGAQVVLHGDVYDDACVEALRIATETGATFVHPFNDEHVAAGQGTLAYEIRQDLPDADIIIVPIGGGGLAAGVATLAKHLNPKVKVLGAEPTGAASMSISCRNGRISPLESVETIADGVAVCTVGDIVFPYVQKYVDDILLVDDECLMDVFLDLTENHKMIAENAGLLSLAAAYQLQKRGISGKKIVCLLSGGNMDVITLSTLVQRGLISRGRIFTFSVLLPDRPGELVNISSIVASHRGNIIRLEHNQFVNINRRAGVELRVTLEADGHPHKQEILQALFEKGYCATEVDPRVVN